MPIISLNYHRENLSCNCFDLSSNNTPDFIWNKNVEKKIFLKTLIDEFINELKKHPNIFIKNIKCIQIETIVLFPKDLTYGHFIETDDVTTVFVRVPTRIDDVQLSCPFNQIKFIYW
jgi:hypothetical protein